MNTEVTVNPDEEMATILNADDAKQVDFMNIASLRDDANDMEKNTVEDEEEDDDESARDPEKTSASLV